MVLTGENICLRAPGPTDVAMLYEWENRKESWKVSNTIIPYSRHQLRQYVETGQDIYANRQMRLMICLNGEEVSIGCIDLFEFDPLHRRAGVGVIIGQNAERGKGYAREALKLLVEYAFTTLQLHQLFCGISVSNEPSLKLFQGQGFEITGTKKDWTNFEGKWEDEHFLQLINPDSK